MPHKDQVRCIFVTGGVVSSLGKGMASASIAALLQAHGYRVRARKFDPYLNVDSGTISPYEHGEVYVTRDGAETDLDLGYYERFTGVDATQSDHVTTGKIYGHVLERERQGAYLGHTVQVVPHITDAIQETLLRDLVDEDFVLWEIGGTVGDIESLPFIEAIRQWVMVHGRHRALFVHLTWIPYVRAAYEFKTKPSQHSVQHLQRLGVQPDILICRSEETLPDKAYQKLSLFCNVPVSRIVSAPDVPTPYHIPLNFRDAGLDREILTYFGLEPAQPLHLDPWVHRAKQMMNPDLPSLRVGVVGKYTHAPDAYKSLREAIEHAAMACGARPQIVWMDTDQAHILQEQGASCHALMVPGGFGVRGTDAKIETVRYAREHGVPFLGICLGMQLAVIETACHILGLDAGSTEFGTFPHPVVGLLTEWAQEAMIQRREGNSPLGGTMRLGAHPCHVVPGTRAHALYGQDVIEERHRHRYEINLAYKDRLEQGGLVFSGFAEGGVLTEIIERPGHPWFMGVQYHPEWQSRPFAPHPLFVSWIQAAMTHAGLEKEISCRIM